MEILHGQYEYLQGGVLILIIMEDTHGDTQSISYRLVWVTVLILIIMEDTHGVIRN